MANALYDKGRQGFLEGSIDWDTDDIRIILVDLADYTVNLATHDNLDDIPAGARVASLSRCRQRHRPGPAHSDRSCRAPV